MHTTDTKSMSKMIVDAHQKTRLEQDDKTKRIYAF